MITKLEAVVPDGARRLSAAKFIERAFPLIGDKRLWQRDIRINGKKSPAESSLSSGDTVTVYYGAQYSFDLSVIFNDGKLLAFFKPAGLPVDIDSDGIGADTVYTRLIRKFPSARLVHRLDTGTSGVMLAALDDCTRSSLEEMFRLHHFKKRYRADAIGVFDKHDEVLTAFLEKDAHSSTVRVITHKTALAKDIKTIYHVLGYTVVNGVTVTRLMVEIPTGRTHQIRAHLAFIGHPLVGDDKYGSRSANKALGVKQIHLSCREIEVADARLMPAYAGMIFACKDADTWM